MPNPPLSSEARRAMLLALDKGVFTRGRKGFYAGFTTTNGTPVKGPTLSALMKSGWLVRDLASRLIKITPQGIIKAEALRREAAETGPDLPPAPAKGGAYFLREQDRKRRAYLESRTPQKSRLPYVD